MLTSLRRHFDVKCPLGTAEPVWKLFPNLEKLTGTHILCLFFFFKFEKAWRESIYLYFIIIFVSEYYTHCYQDITMFGEKCKDFISTQLDKPRILSPLGCAPMADALFVNYISRRALSLDADNFHRIQLNFL